MRVKRFSAATLGGISLLAVSSSNAFAKISPIHSKRNSVLSKQNKPIDSDCEGSVFKEFDQNLKILSKEAERRGLLRRSTVASIVGALGGTVRKAVTDNSQSASDFAGALGGVGFFKGASSSLLTTTLSVLFETMAGHALGRTIQKEGKLTEEEINKLRNIEQFIGSAIGGAVCGSLGQATIDGILLGTLGGSTLIISKAIINKVNSISEQTLKQKNVQIEGKLKNILQLAIGGAIGGAVMSACKRKGTLTIPKEALIGAIRGAIRGILTEEEKARESRINNKS